MKRKVILFIAMSTDGYIATETGDISFLDRVSDENEDYGYERFISSVDTVIVGRKTYDKVLSMGVPFPHQEKDCYVITRSARQPINRIFFYNGDLVKLVNTLRSNPGENIFCDGGAEIANLLMKHKLIDEFIISIIPVLLGGGVRLFGEGIAVSELALVSSAEYPSGLVQLHYSVVRNEIS